jgi:hypothetical protein
MIHRAGDYGFTWSGTMILPSGAMPAASVGIITFDAEGNVWGKQTVSQGGNVTARTFNGTYTLDPDCTGTLTVTVYDDLGNPVNYVTWATVSVDKMSETRLIMTSMMKADGTKVPTIITGFGKRLFPDRHRVE